MTAASGAEELVALANQLGREKFAPRADKWDREASFPFDNYEDLRKAGLLGITVPKKYGGLGAGFAEYCRVSAEIGRWCGSTALTFNMHASTALWSGPLTDQLDMSDEERAGHERRRAIHYGRIVNDGAVFAQSFSETGGAAAGKIPFGTAAEPVDGGWIVNGKKIFASLAGAADYYGLLCTETRGGEVKSRRDTLYLAVPADAEGVSVVGDWDPLGMRGTVSRDLVFENVFVPEDAALMPPGIYYQAVNRWPHMFLTLAPTYLGVAQASYDFTVAYLRGEIEGLPPVKRRMYPTKQIAVAEMYMTLERMRALFEKVIGEACLDPDKPKRLRLFAAQYSIMEGAADLCRLAIRTCGGQSMLKSLPLERLYRDSRCGSLMLPWTAEICLDRLGRETLYETDETDEN